MKKGIDLNQKILVQAGTNMQVVKVTDVAELPVGNDVSVQDVFDWARQEFNLEDDVCAFVPGENGVDTEVLRSKWNETPVPEGGRLLFKPPAKPDGSDLDSLTYRELQERAKAQGIRANQKKAELVAALQPKKPAAKKPSARNIIAQLKKRTAGKVTNPLDEAEEVSFTGRRREDGVIIIPLNLAVAATVEFYKKSGRTMKCVARLQGERYVGQTAMQVAAAQEIFVHHSSVNGDIFFVINHKEVKPQTEIQAGDTLQVVVVSLS